jgi:hypothetical protein
MPAATAGRTARITAMAAKQKFGVNSQDKLTRRPVKLTERKSILY